MDFLVFSRSWACQTKVQSYGYAETLEVLLKSIHSQHDGCSGQVGGTLAAHRDHIVAIAKLLEFLTFPAVAP